MVKVMSLDFGESVISMRLVRGTLEYMGQFTWI